MNRPEPEPALRRPDWCDLCQTSAPAGVDITGHLTTVHADVFGPGPLKWPDGVPVGTTLRRRAQEEPEDVVDDTDPIVQGVREIHAAQLATGGVLTPGDARVVGEGGTGCVLRLHPAEPTPTPRRRFTTMIGALLGRRRKDPR